MLRNALGKWDAESEGILLTCYWIDWWCDIDQLSQLTNPTNLFVFYFTMRSFTTFFSATCIIPIHHISLINFIVYSFSPHCSFQNYLALFLSHQPPWHHKKLFPKFTPTAFKPNTSHYALLHPIPFASHMTSASTPQPSPHYLPIPPLSLETLHCSHHSPVWTFPFPLTRPKSLSPTGIFYILQGFGSTPVPCQVQVLPFHHSFSHHLTQSENTWLLHLPCWSLAKHKPHLSATVFYSFTKRTLWPH